jgi:hypothetical protein
MAIVGVAIATGCTYPSAPRHFLTACEVIYILFSAKYFFCKQAPKNFKERFIKYHCKNTKKLVDSVLVVRKNKIIQSSIIRPQQAAATNRRL